jgi:hypothetical protein
MKILPCFEDLRGGRSAMGQISLPYCFLNARHKVFEDKKKKEMKKRRRQRTERKTQPTSLRREMQ